MMFRISFEFTAPCFGWFDFEFLWYTKFWVIFKDMPIDGNLDNRLLKIFDFGVPIDINLLIYI